MFAGSFENWSFLFLVAAQRLEVQLQNILHILRNSIGKNWSGVHTESLKCRDITLSLVSLTSSKLGSDFAVDEFLAHSMPCFLLKDQPKGSGISLETNRKGTEMSKCLSVRHLSLSLA